MGLAGRESESTESRAGARLAATKNRSCRAERPPISGNDVDQGGPEPSQVVEGPDNRDTRCGTREVLIGGGREEMSPAYFWSTASGSCSARAWSSKSVEVDVAVHTCPRLRLKRISVESEGGSRMGPVGRGNAPCRRSHSATRGSPFRERAMRFHAVQLVWLRK